MFSGVNRDNLMNALKLLNSNVGSKIYEMSSYLEITLRFCCSLIG